MASRTASAIDAGGGGGGGGHSRNTSVSAVSHDGSQDNNTIAAVQASPTVASTRKATQQQPTVDALTATLQSSRIAEAGRGWHVHADAEIYKRLLLQPAAGDAGEAQKQQQQQHYDAIANGAEVANDTATGGANPPSLSVLLHDRVWAQGGEVVLLLGRRRTIEKDSAASRIPISSTASRTPGGANDAADANSATLLTEVEHVDVPFTSQELTTSIANVTQAATQAGCQATVLVHKDESDGGDEAERDIYAYVMLRRIPSSAEELLELRVAVVGNVDAGKSSTLGVLTRGGLDDGRGKARVNLFRHKHEIESGRTSSVGMEIMGFDSHGQVVMNVDSKNSAEPGRKMSWEEVCEKSAKVISFIDLAGHERYLKTTVGGLTGCLPDFVMLMVGANAGLIGMSKEHLGVALALAVPVLVCITKIDMTPPHILEATIKQLTKILRSPGCRKQPIFVSTPEQAVDSALRLGQERICPVFQISNVTGLNLDLLRSFLNTLPQANPAKFSAEAPFKFQLQDVFSVPFVGCVVSGVILSGMVRVGDNLVIGPDSLGQFTNTSVRSIQRKRVNVDAALAGQSASFALKKIRRNQVRKGMVMLGKTLDGQAPPRAVMTCDAEILCLYHSTTLSVGSCMVLHAASVRQTVKIVQIAKLDAHGNIISSTWPTPASVTNGGDRPGATSSVNRRQMENEQRNAVATGNAAAQPDKPVVRTGDRALLRLQFIRTAEYLEPGLKLITREGKTKLIGVVRAVGQSGPLTTKIIATNSAGA